MARGWWRTSWGLMAVWRRREGELSDGRAVRGDRGHWSDGDQRAQDRRGGVDGERPPVVCGGFCWDNAPVGTWVTRVHGTVKHSSIAGSGGFRISLSN